MSALTHALLICISGDHGACSDLCTPPLCPLADIRFNVTRPERFLRRSNATACANGRGREHGQVPQRLLPGRNDGESAGVTWMEMERWGREALTFVAAARRRAEAPF